MWLFDLAFHLKMPMYQLLDEMPSDELNMWAIYLQARPIGWREDNRAAMIVNAQGASVKPQELFPSLKQLHEWENNKKAADSANSSLKSSIFGVKLAKSISSSN